MSRRSLRVALSGAALLAGAIVVSAPAPAEARWGVLYVPRPVRKAPPDQSWLQDVPEKAGARARSKVAVFVFRNDDVYEPVRAAVVRLLRRKGLNVTANLRPVDSAAQYREMSQTLNLAVYIEGELTGEGAKQRARIRLRSGISGQHFASATFSGPTPKIVGDINKTLWTRVGPSVSRACTNASKPRRRERDPLLIDAGSPVDAPIATQGT